MRKILRPILIFLAIVFLVEAWLWDRLEPVVARIVNVIPWGRIKSAVSRWVDSLPPAGTLVVFMVPVGLLIPIKFIEVWFFMNGQWVEGVGTLIFAKLFFLGTTAFVFDVTRDKLLQLDWFRALYYYVIWVRRWARALVNPIVRRIKMRLRILAPRRAPRAFRLLLRIRRRLHSVEQGVPAPENFSRVGITDELRPDAPHAARTGRSR
jgi:hypothetical protein